MNWVGSTEVALLISKATSSLVEEARILAAFNLIFEVYYLICIKCSLPLHLYQMFFNFAFEECRRPQDLTMQVWQPHLLLQSQNLIWGVFFIRLCPSCSLLYTHFIIIIVYYYQIYYAELTPWKRQNWLCNYFVEGHPSGALNLS